MPDPTPGLCWGAGTTLGKQDAQQFLEDCSGRAGLQPLRLSLLWRWEKESKRVLSYVIKNYHSMSLLTFLFFSKRLKIYLEFRKTGKKVNWNVQFVNRHTEEHTRNRISRRKPFQTKPKQGLEWRTILTGGAKLGKRKTRKQTSTLPSRSDKWEAPQQQSTA